MAVLVIAGSGRGAGKTAVGCALMASMPELRWLAVKLTPHTHDGQLGLREELDRDSAKDTGRYLRVGARRAFLLSCADPDAARQSLAALRVDDAGGSLLVEANRVEPRLVAQAGEPAMCLAVLASPRESWKPSLLDSFEFADAFVLTGGLTRKELPDELRMRPAFRLAIEEWSSPRLEERVRGLLL